MQFSHSRVETHNQCPYKYYLRYVEKVKTIPVYEADNPLIIGNALHKGIETKVKQAIDWYYDQFPIIGDKHIEEALKLEILIPKVKNLLETMNVQEFEHKILSEHFIGFVDLITAEQIIDFKYSNNQNRYQDSPQLHLYKFFMGSDLKLSYIFVPKTAIRMKKTEDQYQFRKRLNQTLEQMEPSVKSIQYDPKKVIKFILDCKTIEEATELLADFPPNQSKLCDWCEYEKFCLGGCDYMIELPKNERKEAKINLTPDMWLYGDSYSGKTVFMDSFDNVLMVNTDGNVDHITSPVFRLKDEVTVEGRITKRRFAWDVFLDLITELEKKQNEFQTIVIDLVEDVFEHCRLYMYDKLSIDHEQDAGYGKGWDMVRTEFLSNMKRLKNSGYQIVYISKSQTNEITKRNGEKVTTIKPNINDKVANVLAGTVDLTAQVVADGDVRTISFKTSPYVFGGSRYNFAVKELSLNKEAFLEGLKQSQGEEINQPIQEQSSAEKQTAPEELEQPVNEEKTRRTRKSKIA